MTTIKLNDQQQKAISTSAKYTLVLAGAGSGKTTVIMNRIEYLLKKHRHIKANNLLVLTFSNKAALEIKQRCSKYSLDINFMKVSTFHSFGLGVLSRYNNTKRVIDEQTAVDILRDVITDINVDTMNKSQNNAEQIMNRIQILKNELKEPSNETGDSEYLIEIYDRYQKKMESLNVLDFGDIMINLRNLFIERPNICRFYQMQFKHILVDEYQDVNLSQYVILRMLLQNQLNDLYCVADDDQLIYEWRGANIINILHFKNHFPIRSEVIYLDVNYRSTKVILEASNSLIRNNINRHQKLIKCRKYCADYHKKEIDEYDKIDVHKFYDDEAEAYGIAAILEKIIKSDNVSVGILLRKRINIKLIGEALNAFDISFYDESDSGDNQLKMASYSVFLSTIHASKGMEFDVVFLPCFEEGILPASCNKDEIEEERRVAYVGITRAKAKAILSYTCFRIKYAERHQSIKSRFISELQSRDCILFDHTSTN